MFLKNRKIFKKKIIRHSCTNNQIRHINKTHKKRVFAFILRRWVLIRHNAIWRFFLLFFYKCIFWPGSQLNVNFLFFDDLAPFRCVDQPQFSLEFRLFSIAKSKNINSYRYFLNFENKNNSKEPLKRKKTKNSMTSHFRRIN